MNLTIVASPSASHQMQYGRALQAGLKRHGIVAPLVHSHESVRSDTVAVWGWRRGEFHRAQDSEVLVLERGYLADRFAWCSMGWNGLNGRATFGDWQDGGRRFRDNFGHLLGLWNPGGEYVLLIGQVPGDAALAGRCLRPWYAEQAERAAKLYALPVRFRPHPLAARRGGLPSVPGAETMAGDLVSALRGAALVVTWNSNTAVESLLAGKLTVAMDAGSMAWGVALSDLPSTLDVKQPARRPWLHALAWRQFTLAEIESGAAWDIAGSVCRGN